MGTFDVHSRQAAKPMQHCCMRQHSLAQMDLAKYFMGRNAGLPADGTIAAEVAFMFNEWYQPNACLEFPRGGSQAIVQALVRCSHSCNLTSPFNTSCQS